MVAANNGSTSVQYDYDGEGRRVRKTETGGGGVTTVYVYDAGGMLTAEYSQACRQSPETGERYLTEDHLGSTRLVTDGSGAAQQRLDYFPFGQTIPMGASYGNRNLVTGYGGADQSDAGIHRQRAG